MKTFGGFIVSRTFSIKNNEAGLIKFGGNVNIRTKCLNLLLDRTDGWSSRDEDHTPRFYSTFYEFVVFY